MAGRKIAVAVGFFIFCFQLASFSQQSNCSLSSQFYAKDSINIVTFGASTVQGVGGVGFQGFLEKDINHCYSGKVITVQNYGIAGETTAQGLDRIDAAIQNKTGFIFILMGANDASRIVDNKLKVSDTEANMRIMVKKSLAANLTVILGTLQNYNDTRSAYNKKLNAAISKINDSYRKIAKEYNLQVADINGALGRNFQLYHDEIHPNNKGYMLLGFVWFDALNKAIEEHFLELYVSQNFPNPGVTSTSIIYTIPSAGKVELALFNLNGKLVKYLIDEFENTGVYTKTFDITDLNPGIYIYVFQTNSRKITKKMIVSR